jgi:hypothetical protein
MELAIGDNIDPLSFALMGVGSLDGHIALSCVLRLKRGEENLLQVVHTLEDLLKECDELITAFAVKSEGDTDIHDLSISWAFTASELNGRIKGLRNLAEGSCRPSDKDLVRAGTLYDWLVTRRMTFLKNGL